MRYIFLLLSALLSLPSNALITSDVIDTQIIRVYDQNIIAISRGLEDGIFKASHVKLTSKNGFIARGIALKSNMTFSYIKIYRVVRPELVSKDTLYDLKDMHQSEIPDDLKYLKSASLPYSLKEIKPSELKKQLKLQQNRIANFDLPESIATAEAKKPSETETFIAKNINYDQFKKDISNVNFQFFASPYQTQSITNQTNAHFGFFLNNSGKKYEFKLLHEQTRSEVISPYTQEKMSSSRHRTSLFFDVKRINPNWSYFMYASREEASIGAIRNPGPRTNYGLFGFKYHIIDALEKNKSTGMSQLNLSYIPLYESYKFQSFVNQRDESDGIQDNDLRYLRHAFRLKGKFIISKDTEIQTTAWWRPAQNIDNAKFDFLNTLTDINTVYSTRIVNKLYLDYSVRYTYDINNQDYYGISPSNLINTVRFRYKVGLNF